jgi:hypothetical protein
MPYRDGNATPHASADTSDTVTRKMSCQVAACAVHFMFERPYQKHLPLAEDSKICDHLTDCPLLQLTAVPTDFTTPI